MTLKSPETGRRRGPPLVLALVVAAALLAACGEKQDTAATQTAAKVNKDEITVHQINFVLQQQRNLRPEQAEAASKQVLERLIDQQLALQKAEEAKVDRDPRVLQQLEAARREVIARAYLEKIGEAAPKPSPEEIKKYYDEKPALFSQRRVYQIQEIGIEASQDKVPEIREKLAAAKSINEFVEYLKTTGLRFSGNQAVRAAEQLPLNSLDALSKMKDGQAIVVPTPTGMQVVVLAGSRMQPVSEEQARPAIEQFLVNERRRKLVEDDVKAMRTAAKIEYMGKFAEAAPSAGSAAAAKPTSPVAPTAPAASDALSGTDVSKGLGLK
jgi:EpsD family peptidyl-prolyl cis-trans isomerase